MEGEIGFDIIHANIGVVDVTYKINTKKSVHLEVQHLYSKQERKNWAMALLEYSISPNWSFTFFDEYNYGNDEKDLRIHYYNASLGYTLNGTHISLGYGRQRSGLLCVGGVCRFVPASNGWNISITSRF